MLCVGLNNFKFQNGEDKWLFRWYTEGKSFREIMRKYNSRFKASRGVMWIFYRVDKLRQEMEAEGLWEAVETLDSERDKELIDAGNVLIGLINKPDL